MGPDIPEGEGPGVPLSMRYPKKLLDRIDAVAKHTHNTRTDAIMYMLRWAVTAYEEEREKEKSLAKRP